MAYSTLQIAALHKQLDAVLKQFAADNKLVAGASRIKYGATDFKVEVSFGDANANPDAVDPRYLMDLKRRGFTGGSMKLKPSTQEQRDAALADLVRMIADGREYPDAIWAVTQRHKVSHDELQEMYDALDG